MYAKCTLMTNLGPKNVHYPQLRSSSRSSILPINSRRLTSLFYSQPTSVTSTPLPNDSSTCHTAPPCLGRSRLRCDVKRGRNPSPAPPGADTIDYDAPVDRLRAAGHLVEKATSELDHDIVVDDDCYLGKDGSLDECVPTLTPRP